MNHVERFRAVMNFEPVDRLPRIEWAMWWDEMRRGGFIPSVDHQTPPHVTIDEYRLFRRLLDEYTLAAAQ